MAKGPERLTGGCNCGAVRFVATGPFRPPIACHCRSCRRQSGHFIAATQTDADAVIVTGAEHLTIYRATPHARRCFCRLCGAHLFWQRESGKRRSIYMGCLDEPTGLGLERHIFVAEKGDYYLIDDGLPQDPARRAGG